MASLKRIERQDMRIEAGLKRDLSRLAERDRRRSSVSHQIMHEARLNVALERFFASCKLSDLVGI